MIRTLAHLAATAALALLPTTMKPADAQVTAPLLPPVPTTKVLAIGSVPNAHTSGAAAAVVMPREVDATVRLYLDGKIDQWYVRKDTRGVVFLMNVATIEEAHALLEKLPLGVAGIMKFELIPIGPLSPLHYLLASPAAAPSKTAE